MSELSRLPNRDMSALLMAVIDGEADAAEEARVRAALAADPALAAEAEAYRMTGRSLSELFDAILTEPVPGQLLHTVMTAGGEPQPSGGGRRTRRQGLWAWLDAWRLPVVTLAASAAAFSAGLVLAPALIQQPVSVGADIAAALSQATAGAEQTLTGRDGSAVQFRLVQTFHDSVGAVCREFEAQRAAEPRQYGVACRQDGAWRVRAMLLGGVPAAAGPKSRSEFGTANVDLSAALDEVAGRFQVGETLGVEEERKLIADGWRSGQ